MIWAVTLIALGGAMAIEGAAWAIFPKQMRELYSMMFREGDRMLHISGLISVAIGVLMIGYGAKLIGS